MSTSMPETVLSANDEAFLALADVQAFTEATLHLLTLVEESGHKYLTTAHVRDLLSHVLALAEPTSTA